MSLQQWHILWFLRGPLYIQVFLNMRLINVTVKVRHLSGYDRRLSAMTNQLSTYRVWGNTCLIRICLQFKAVPFMGQNPSGLDTHLGDWLDMKLCVQVLVRSYNAQRQEHDINDALERLHTFPNQQRFIT